jgi:hypothetical protein
MRDGGKKYSLVEEKFFACEKGMYICKITLRILEKNRKVEVTRHYILEMAQAVRINTSLPEFLWPQAITHMVEVRNLTPKKS